jgi:hypothetical protein
VHFSPNAFNSFIIGVTDHELELLDGYEHIPIDLCSAPSQYYGHPAYMGNSLQPMHHKYDTSAALINN